ncbi:MAG: tRNA (guanosine(46)-N7)-methyltransferase TrmB [Pseudomonadales bacterium]
MTAPEDPSPAAVGGFRTYVRRRGRLTRGQARALRDLTDRYLLAPEPDSTLDPVALFGRAAPLGLEVGFGMGQGLVEWAREQPDWNLLGVEVYQPGIGSAMLGLERGGFDHVRLLEGPAEWLLGGLLAPQSLDELRIFFPDPWPKKRHHKRRLVQPALAALVADRLKPGGLVWVATDWEDYAHWIVEVLDAEPRLRARRPARVESARATAAVDRERETLPDLADDRPRTRFEARGLRLGHRVWDLRYERKR